MRIDLKKYLFVGLEIERHDFFKKAQTIGIIHFVDKTGKISKEIPAEVENIIKAIKILRGLPPTEQEETQDDFLTHSIVNQIISIKKRLDRLAEEERILHLEISRVQVFGNFTPEDVKYIEKHGKRKIQFFCSRTGALKGVEHQGNLIYIGTDHGLDYFIAVNPMSTQYDKMIEMHIEHPLGMLKNRLHDVLHEVHRLEHELKTYAKYHTFLHNALIITLNKHHLQKTQNCAQNPMESHLFAIEGWVPVNKNQELMALVDEMSIYCEEVAVESKDVVPTYLDNQGTSRIGEDLVHIYDTPSPTDKDPSPWVLWAFCLFFAFIVGDGGYGLLYLGLSLYLLYKFPNAKGIAKRVLNLFTILSAACVIWGVLTGSFFGIKFDIDSPIRKMSLTQWLAEKKAAYHINHHDATYEEWVKQLPQLKGVDNPHEFLAKGSKTQNGETHYIILDKFTDNIMMELALLIGVVHITISLLRYAGRNWASIGWIIFMWGAYLYIPWHLHATSMLHYVFGIDPEKGSQVGVALVFWGLGIAFVLAIIKHRWLGLVEPMTAITIFADILSYLRLYALGLAGAIVGATINELTASIPFLFGVVIMFLAHSLNMLLGIMSGVIHGLRLNFLEWYHYSFEGGGIQFKPLNLIEPE